MQDPISTPPIVVEWLGVQARITVFHPDEALARGLSEWWGNAFGEPPEKIETKPREHSQLVSGTVAYGQLAINAGQGRTDFILGPNSEALTESNPIWPVPAIGSYRQMMNNMTEPVGKWLESSPPVYRLAVGARLLAPGPELDAVHSVLSVFLPELNLRGLATPDFTFRVNRARSATSSPGVLINRLATWSIAEGQSVAIAPNRPLPPATRVQYAAHLELDINTRPNDPGERFGINTSLPILDELIGFAIEIAEQGDKP